MKQRSVLLKLHNLTALNQSQDDAEFDMLCGQVCEDLPADMQTLPLNAVFMQESNQAQTPFQPQSDFGGVHRVEPSFGIGSDWAMMDERPLSQGPLVPTVTPVAEQSSNLYSFFFEQEIQMDEDDNSVSLHDDIELEDADFCLEGMKENPEAFWARSCEMMTMERQPSPAVISLPGDVRDEIYHNDSL